ncbi:MAG: PEGA domain-containing protein [Vicinamibacterales bacterium]
MSPRTLLRQVSGPVLDLQNLQLTISIRADKGLLDKSSVIRVSLRSGGQPAATDSEAQPAPPTLAPPTAFNEMFEFPTEGASSDAAVEAPASPVTPAWAQRVGSMMRVTTLVAFVAGVVVGASAVVLSLSMPAPPAVSGPLPPSSVPVAGIPPPRTVARSARPARPAAVPAGNTVGDGVYRSSLVVESNPRGAGVYLNNQPVGTTPLNLDGLPVGSRAVRLELPGYERWSSAIVVTTEQVARVSADLHPLESSPR